MTLIIVSSIWLLTVLAYLRERFLHKYEVESLKQLLQAAEDRPAEKLYQKEVQLHNEARDELRRTVERHRVIQAAFNAMNGKSDATDE